MALLQQNQPALVDVGDRDLTPRRQWVTGRHRQQKRIVEQRQRLDVGAVHRQRQHHAVERASGQLFEQQLGLGLAHLQAQLRMEHLEPWQHARQHIGRQRWDDAEAKPPAQQVAVAGEVDQVAGGGEDALGPLRHIDTNIGEHDLARTPLHQFGADLALEFAHLHGQGRLGHGTVFRGPSEMPVARERGQITQLTQGDHADKICLSRQPSNTIRPDR